MVLKGVFYRAFFGNYLKKTHPFLYPAIRDKYQIKIFCKGDLI